MYAIMMSVLTTLKYSLGGPEQPKEYLQKTNMTLEQIECMNFVPNKPKGRDQQLVDSSLPDAWTWFRTDASDAASLCGFLLRLTEMGCRKQVDTYTQLDQLDELAIWFGHYIDGLLGPDNKKKCKLKML
jgi:hypothetical protein